MASLNGCYAKLKQAKHHLSLLVSAQKRGFESGRFKLVSHEEPNGDLVQSVSFPESEALKIGVRIGDVIHNSRSALDHLVWQLVLTDGNSPGYWTQFPIVDNANKFPLEHGRKRDLKGVSPEAFRYIKSVQPFYSGIDDPEHPLLNLRDLSNRDKHRIVTPVGHGFRVKSVSYRASVFETPFNILISSRSPGDSTRAGSGPFVDGDEAFRLTPDQRESEMELQVSQSISFGEGRGLKGRHVTVVLQKAVSEVQMIIDGAQLLTGNTDQNSVN